PILADIDDELVDAVVGKIELAEKTARPKIANIGRIAGILVQTRVGEAEVWVIARIRIAVYPIHDDMDIACMEFVDQCRQAPELYQRRRIIIVIIVFHGEKGDGVITPAKAIALGPGGPGHEFDRVDTELRQVIDL